MGLFDIAVSNVLPEHSSNSLINALPSGPRQD
jgi:hypothetical protein